MCHVITRMQAYSRSHGFFGGISVDGMMLVTRDADNAGTYGRPLSVHEILNGDVEPPPEGWAIVFEYHGPDTFVHWKGRVCRPRLPWLLQPPRLSFHLTAELLLALLPAMRLCPAI